MDNNKILQTAAEAGRIILENGGETYRVEETIVRICDALGAKEGSSFVTPTGIMISIIDEEGNSISLIKRVMSRRFDIEKISQVNDLSRNICKQTVSINFVKSELARIDKLKGYPPIFVILFAAFAAGFSTLIFGGNINDFAISFICGVVIKSLSLKLNRLRVNDFFINVLGGATAAIISLFSVYFKLAPHLDKIIIGAIMLLVPGLSITNAIRDTIEGDLVSGVSRAVEATFTAVAIAVGTGLVLKLWSVIFGGIFI